MVNWTSIWCFARIEDEKILDKASFLVFSVVQHYIERRENAMTSFGDTLRQLRVAQGLGLRETATAVAISPSYLSRIERNIEKPPKPELIKSLAKLLAADPDVLFRLSSSTDPEIACLVKENPKIRKLVRLFIDHEPTDNQLERILHFAEKTLASKKPAD